MRGVFVIVLGLDTATPSTVVGLRLDDGTVLEARDDPTEKERPGHATRLLPLARGLLSDAGLDWDAVARVAVGVGPGTFTGLRIGVATARGIAQSLGSELVGVSSLRALAHIAHTALPDQPMGVLSAIDARRGEVFVAAYDGEVELVAPRTYRPHDVDQLIEHAGAGSEIERWTAVGAGALRYREAFRVPCVFVPEEDSALHCIQARAICELGTFLPTYSPADTAAHSSASAPTFDMQVVPDYLRRPDAEIALEEAVS